MGLNIENALAIDGFMSESELHWLAENTRLCKTVVEIGSWKGRSSRAIADNMSAKGTLFCIDSFEGQTHYYSQLTMRKIGGPNGLYKLFLENMKPHIQTKHVIPIRSTSVEAVRLLQKHDKFPARGADLVFIDGLHTYGAVVADISNYQGLVRHGGILCGHDTNKRSVVHAVEDAFGLEYNRQDGKKPKHWESVRNHKSTEKIWWVKL